MGKGALSRYRICDFSGILAGAGATKWLAAFGADVIRIEDPVRQGMWDIMRAFGPYVDERRGIEMSGGFNNHNTGKRGITVNLRTDKGRAIVAEIIRRSDVVAENFAAGVLAKMGFPYERMRELRADIVYVSNCGFGHRSPYWRYKTWGPIAQALGGLTFSAGLPDMEPAGWGYSYMDHTAAYYMAMAILLALVHRERTGEGQWVDLASTDATLTLNGPALLDWDVNHRPLRRPGQPHGNRNDWPPMAPHGVYPAAGDDEWIAIAVRNDDEWRALGAVAGAPWCADPAWATLAARHADQDALDAAVAGWTRLHDKFDLQARLRAARIAAAAVQRPQERIDQDPTTGEFGLWPEVTHPHIGRVRVDGLPVHLSRTDWTIDQPAPCLGQHNEEVLHELLGMSREEVAALRAEGVL
ncbi:MAG: CaiB/BaiF CoA transferase family protein [Gammaproteobacteria bacterium]